MLGTDLIGGRAISFAKHAQTNDNLLARDLKNMD
jgi:hypothetical protein